MKKGILLTIILILMFISLPSVTKAMDYGSMESPNHVEVIKIAGDKNYPPYEYVDENGNYKGFNVDIMRAIAIELGIDIEIIPMTWNEALIALENGEVDAIQGMTKSRVREKVFSFTDALVENSQAIFVRKDTNYISDLSDLSGVKVAFQKGDISSEAIDKFQGIIPVVKENQYLAMDALLMGEVDAIIGNRLTGLYYLQKGKKANEVKIVGEPMYVTEYSSATLKKNTETLEVLNKGINGIKKNGTYDKIYKKWFGETFNNNDPYWRRLLFILTIVLLGALTIIAIIFHWNRVLKKEVENRTEELQLQQEKLDKSNRLRGKILESIVSGIIAFNNKGQVLTANYNAKDLLEMDIEAGTDWRDLRLNDEIQEEDFVKALNGQSWRRNVNWTRGNGEERFVHCNILPIRGPEENEGVILLLHDYTKEKNLEDMVNHNDKMQALGKLSAGIAHELRNPLTSIKAFVDLIPEKIENPNFREQLIKIVPQEIQRLNNLVSLLLDYSKPKASSPQIIFLPAMLDEILFLFSMQLVKNNIKVEKNLLPLSFWADIQQIKQVMINIILNGIEAIGENGKIVINSYLSDKKLVIETIDNGCGIPQEKIAKVFDPFFTMKKHGYGIGLSISHQLVKENKGEIHIDSTIGEGTTVSVQFPAIIEKEDDLNG